MERRLKGPNVAMIWIHFISTLWIKLFFVLVSINKDKPSPQAPYCNGQAILPQGVINVSKHWKVSRSSAGRGKPKGRKPQEQFIIVVMVAWFIVYYICLKAIMVLFKCCVTERHWITWKLQNLILPHYSISTLTISVKILVLL
jgi:hypothetical protein